MTSTLDAYAGLTRKRTAVLAALSTALMLSLLLDLSAGPAGLGLWDIVVGILDPDSLDPRHRVILWQVRMPDALIAVVVGACLGLAGVESQTILDNPLASPFTLGVSAAAVLGASVAIILAPSMPLIPQTAALPVLALLFALGAGMVILAVVRFGNGARETVVLFGIALVFLCNALTSALHYVADADAIQQIVFWTIGNLTKAGWWEVAIVTACFLTVLPFSLRHVWWMTMLRGGEAYARSAGLDVAKLRVQVIFRTSVLAAFAVCFVGSIGFVGLVGPHIARLLLGEDHRALVPGAVLCGALMLSVASFLSKSVLPGAIVPVGILTAVIGVPVFLGLLALQRRMR
ncbi:iron ABC transporter permease [Thalassobaculum sp. OXR-137]|uniref:FecCD family ABC transporter permease n=1 Tax=Thalassobaculum sp. OXR-137 TaxID=3100173 RepID=UPI002AC9B011|nr:iron ABC transporter permease [Thalassobaculum sp. OXR-137]WPZ32363.1 iron ABC transporter permease [Thalassobaculum sp. OXR-137]